jgi:hypothetical protein
MNQQTNNKLDHYIQYDQVLTFIFGSLSLYVCVCVCVFCGMFSVENQVSLIDYMRNLIKTSSPRKTMFQNQPLVFVSWN